MKTLALVLLLTVLPAVASADEFQVVGVFPAEFSLPDQISVSFLPFIQVKDVPAIAGGESLDFDIFFTPVALAPDGENFGMSCDAPHSLDPEDLCFLSLHELLTFQSDPYTISNGVLTFVPGVYANGNFIVTAPEPSSWLLLTAGLLGVWRKKTGAAF